MSARRNGMHHRPVLCFGEMLWDLLPTGQRPGGAPLNVAVYLHRMGQHAIPISAIGADRSGDELLNVVRGQHLPTYAICRHSRLSTGRVDVEFDGQGEPVYRIDEPSAWDEIALDDDILDDARNASAIVFGTLAQRSAHNRKTLERLLAELPYDALRVFDVNLRPPSIDLDRLWELAAIADVVKVNRAELKLLIGEGTIECRARRLAERTGGTIVCVTMGADGAALLNDGAWTCVAAAPAEVVDTVGAGDAFLAAVVDGLLDRQSDGAVLGLASILAGYVAENHGAF